MIAMVELKSDDVRTLTDLGFIAVSYGHDTKAAAIFAGVRAARPTQEAGFIGGALVNLARGEIEAAINTLRSLPPTDAARTFLAIALNRSGDRAAAREVLNDVVKTADETSYARLARQLLEELDKPAPVLR
jgi:thioredoxin-like negative regulator of GroEL